MVTNKKIQSIVILLIAFIFYQCAVNPVTGKKEVMFMNEQQEIALGTESDPQIIAMYGQYQDEKIQKFITEKGNEMAAISHRPNLKFQFKILDSPVINAFALPGGFVYFTRGILAHFNNEAEFAGVLGHEIGHVTARHSAKQYTKSQIAQILLIGGIIAKPELVQFMDIAQTGLGLLFLKYGRDNESQSDQLGAEYSTKIGYDANNMANFFQTLNRLQSKSEAGEIPTFLSTHPHPIDRYNKVRKAAEEWQSKDSKHSEYAVNRNGYLQMINGIVYGEDPRQGFVENNVFYHPEMKFYYPIPTNWKTVNTPSQVQMAPKDGKALIMLTIGQGNSMEEASQNFITQYKLNQISSTRNAINGFQALTVVSEQINEQDPKASVSLLSNYISFDGMILVFHGVAGQSDFNSYRPYFNQTARGFNRLKDRSKLNKQPERLQVKKVTKSGSLSGILSSWGVPPKRHEEMAVLNSMKLKDQIGTGTLIKFVK